MCRKLCLHVLVFNAVGGGLSPELCDRFKEHTGTERIVRAEKHEPSLGQHISAHLAGAGQPGWSLQAAFLPNGSLIRRGAPPPRLKTDHALWDLNQWLGGASEDV